MPHNLRLADFWDLERLQPLCHPESRGSVIPLILANRSPFNEIKQNSLARQITLIN